MANVSRSDQRIGRTMAESEPRWESPRAAPPGAPDIVVVLLDDAGFSDLGCFGAEIRTPTIDRLARGGATFTQYTTVPMCTPARAALMTGMNPHAVGCGWLTMSDPGYPGYRSGEMSLKVPTLPEILRAGGYSTYGVGKWHNTAIHKVSPAGDRDTWPLQRGFDRFFGFLAGEMSFFAPGHLVAGNEFVDTDDYPEDFYCTDAWTDKSLAYLQAHHAASQDKPFFLYLAHNAPHVPLQARPADIERYRGVYADGWEAIRERRFERQKQDGVVPANWRLSKPGPLVPRWSELDDERKALFCRYMEIYAAMIESVDTNLARIVSFLEQCGRLDNTLFVITSDNGATSIGGLDGAVNVVDRRTAKEPDIGAALRSFNDGSLGSVNSYSVYPAGWGNVCNAPFRMYKRTPMNGGIRVPMVMSWPRGIRQPGVMRHNWVHVTDLLPTLLSVAGCTYPEAFKGVATPGLHGHSAAAMFDDASAATARRQQYFELEANRAYILGHWKIVSLQPQMQPLKLDNWMLFNLADDPTECDDLAAQHPEKLQELLAAFEADAQANHVYPLDNRDHRRMLALPPHLENAYNQPRTFYPPGGSLPADVFSPLIADRNYRVEYYFDYAPGDEGVIAALGNVLGGWSLHVTDGNVVLAFASGGRSESMSVPAEIGNNVVTLIHEATGERRGRGTLSSTSATATMDMSPTLIRLTGDGFDIGRDRRLKVTAYPRPGSFPYSGEIQSVRVEPGAQAPGSIANVPEREAQRGAPSAAKEKST